MDFEGFRAWLDAYVRACKTNDPEDVTRLFAEDAEYYPGPFDEPYRGSASIAEHWADDPWTVGPRFDARVEPLLFEDGLGVAEWWVSYPEAPLGAADEYSSIFVLRFDDRGRCTEYREWWMARGR
jgi:SnoaL-like domain